MFMQCPTFISGKKARGTCVAITATHSSTVVEAVVSLVRTLHALPVWNSVINDAITDRLSLVAQLLSDLAQFQLKVSILCGCKYEIHSCCC